MYVHTYIYYTSVYYVVHTDSTYTCICVYINVLNLHLHTCFRFMRAIIYHN